MRVNGPYYDKRTDTWYLKEFHHVGRGGSRRLAYPTEQAAKDGLTKIQAILARPEETTVQEALDQWIAERTAFVKNVRRQTRMMADFLAPDLAKPVSRLCEDRAQALYGRLVSLPAQRGDRLVPRSAAYQQSALGHAKEWGRWLVRKKYLRASPFADVAPVGRAKAGPESKVWLDPSQLGRWARAAEEAIREGAHGEGAIAAYLGYAIGLRASEPGTMHALQPSVPATETTPGRPARARFRVKGTARQKIRHLWLLLPEWLAPLFEERAAKGLPLLTVKRDSVRKAVLAICKRAGVPLTCPHGIRQSMIDYQTALEAEEGSLDQRQMERMAALHGHTASIMERHYMQPGRADEARAARRLRVIEGGRSPGFIPGTFPGTASPHAQRREAQE